MTCALPSGGTRDVVLVADGAGGFKIASTTLRATVSADSLPLAVETFDWTHGHWRVLADQIDRGHAADEGARLARRVCDLLRQTPDVRVSLLGHSAGCAVVLAAAESLPPGSVERIVLLAPAVSADHDLRPSLACARCGIDVFYSSNDVFYLGLGVALLGTPDGERTAAAGRVGFRPPPYNSPDASLYTKLRQYPWEPCLVWTGNHGGHYGPYQPGFLRTAVLPLLVPQANPPCGR